MSMHLRRRPGADHAHGRPARRLARIASFVILLAVVGGLGVLLAAGPASADGLKPTITKDVDANGDNVFNDTENVPKNVTYPWTVTYRLTIAAGSFSSHTIVAITDSTTNDIGSCQALVGTVIAANSQVQCTYTESFSQAGSSPFVNTATLTYDGGGSDVLSNDSTVNFPGMTLDKSSTTTLITSAGQVVPYSYLVANTGTSALTGISLSDNNTDSPPACPATTLAVGGSMTCTGQHTVTSAEFAAGGNLVNLAVASSNEAPDASDTVSIPIARSPVNDGALTIGYWQNKNGQGIISGQAQTGTCPSTGWLRQFHPFSDLSSSATCSQVATYAYNVIKAATCGGSSCNAMLKAQMLATALNVYFSDPALGGNKISAPGPIGNVLIDLTKICTNIPTCSTFEDDSAQFGGSPKTVLQMLEYQNTSDPAVDAGAVWYGQVKANQTKAKDAFDAVNNQVALGP